MKHIPSPRDRVRLTLECLEDRLCPSYTVIDLGTLPGATSSFARAVNESAQVVGQSRLSTGEHAFIWQNGTMTDLGTLGGTTSAATDINDVGQIVGLSKPMGSNLYHAVLWQGGTITDLGTLGGASSSASAINNHGQIVGASTNAAGVSHPFVWENGVMYDLQELLPANSGWDLRSGANDINDNGQIVGSGYINGLERAFLITDNDGIYANGGASITNLGVLSGGSYSSADGINNAGKVVGYSNVKSGELHAFVSSGGVMTDIKTLGGPHAFATAVNDVSQVVGSSLTQKLTYNDDYRAFLWQNGKMTDLNKLRPRGSAGTLCVAQDVNNAGYIVGDIRFGTAYAPTDYHAFLMVPGATLQADAIGAEPVAQTLGLDQVQPLVDEAIARWHAAGADASSLGNIDIRIADLGGTMLGLASGNTIWLDDNAAGWGWFVDATPWDDSEFITPGDQGEQNRMDLLSVLMHEVGHVMGHDHDEGGVMAETLSAGERLTLHGVDVQEAWWLAGLPDTTKKRDVFGWWL